jgi:hypothetical protein
MQLATLFHGTYAKHAPGILEVKHPKSSELGKGFVMGGKGARNAYLLSLK